MRKVIEGLWEWRPQFAGALEKSPGEAVGELWLGSALWMGHAKAVTAPFCLVFPHYGVRTLKCWLPQIPLQICMTSFRPKKVKSEDMTEVPREHLENGQANSGLLSPPPSSYLGTHITTCRYSSHPGTMRAPKNEDMFVGWQRRKTERSWFLEDIIWLLWNPELLSPNMPCARKKSLFREKTFRFLLLAAE